MQRFTFRKARFLGIICAVIIAVIPLLTFADSDMFTVENVLVDQRDKTATAARTKAISEGQEKAFSILVERLTSGNTKPPKVTSAQIASMVRSFEVKDEKIASDRYRATLTVSFNSEYVRSVLHTSNVSFSETKSTPLLLLPIFQNGEKTMLWDRDNPWRAVWNDAVTKGHLSQYSVPTGDLEDIATITPAKALMGDYTQLQNFVQKYGGSGIVVMLAQYKVIDASHAELNISFRTMNNKETKNGALIVGGTPATPIPALLRNATQQVITTLGHSTTANDNGAVPAMQVIAKLPVASIQEWSMIYKRLQALPFITALKIEALSVREVVISFSYTGDFQQLITQLRSNNFYLLQDHGIYTLRSAL